MGEGITWVGDGGQGWQGWAMEDKGDKGGRRVTRRTRMGEEGHGWFRLARWAVMEHEEGGQGCAKDDKGR